jgi:hypothetical protein
MPRSFLKLLLKVTVMDGERAFLIRKGRFKKVLEPGRYHFFDPWRKRDAEIFYTVRAEFPANRYAVLKASNPDVAARLFTVVETRASEVAVVNFDGRPAHLFGPLTMRVFWKITTRVDVERIDLRVDREFAARHFRMLWRLKELESIERLAEKVGRIDLHAGDDAGLNGLFTQLVRLKAPEHA